MVDDSFWSAKKVAHKLLQQLDARHWRACAVVWEKKVADVAERVALRALRPID